MSFRSSTNPVEALPNRRIGSFGSKTWVCAMRLTGNGATLANLAITLLCCRELNALNG